jgi:hypothetical protein
MEVLNANIGYTPGVCPLVDNTIFATRSGREFE